MTGRERELREGWRRSLEHCERMGGDENIRRAINIAYSDMLRRWFRESACGLMSFWGLR